MTKFLYFNIPATGHINAALPVINLLIESGHEVIYANTESTRTKIESTSATFVAYPDVGQLPSFAGLLLENTATIGLALLEIAEALMPFIDDLIAQEQPDIIIHDSLAGWGKLAARKHQLPTIGFCTMFAMGPQLMASTHIAATLINLFQIALITPNFRLRSRRIQKEHNIEGLAFSDTLACYGDITLVFTAPELQPSVETFDDSFKFVGPTLAQHHEETTFDFEQLTESPLVYIALGTIAHGNTKFYQTCFEAFGNQPGQYILSAGKDTDIAALGNIPDNFLVYNFVPQLEVLQHVDIFVTHAGTNSVHEAMIYSVPLIAIPQQVEQSITASQIVDEKVGVGIQLKPPYGQTDPKTLRNALNEVLSDASYKQNAGKMGQALIAAGGAERAVNEIIQFVEQQ